MKPIELLNGINIHYNIYSVDKITIYPYLNEDCIVAYDKNKLGSIFIIKGKRKCFAFFHVDNKLSHLFFSCINCRRMDMKTALQLLGDCKILNEEEYSKIRKQIILESL